MFKPVAQAAAISNDQKLESVDREKTLAPPQQVVILTAHLTYGTAS
jgi:hypothetical protein